MPFSGKENPNRWRGCMFCLTGQENKVASLVEMLWPEARAYSVSAAKRRSRNGEKNVGIEVIMPGYVFFEADENFSPVPPYPDGVIRVLKTVDGNWKLTGHDDEFARWLIENDGVLGLSRAHRVGERIVIHAGPLKELEGCIQKIDRRNRNGLVQIEVGGNRIRVWLPFEIVEQGQIQRNYETDRGCERK